MLRLERLARRFDQVDRIATPNPPVVGLFQQLQLLTQPQHRPVEGVPDELLIWLFAVAGRVLFDRARADETRAFDKRRGQCRRGERCFWHDEQRNIRAPRMPICISA